MNYKESIRFVNIRVTSPSISPQRLATHAVIERGLRLVQKISRLSISVCLVKVGAEYLFDKKGNERKSFSSCSTCCMDTCWTASEVITYIRNRAVSTVHCLCRLGGNCRHPQSPEKTLRDRGACLANESREWVQECPHNVFGAAVRKCWRFMR